MDRSDGMNRRDAARLLGGAALAAGAAARAGAPADAARGWCRVDPVVKIAGGVADVRLSGPRALHDAATGATEIVVAVPPGTAAEHLASDRGFGGFGYDVRFREDPDLGRGGRLEAVVDAFVPGTDGSLPVRVDFFPRSSELGPASAEGTANVWIRLRTR